MSPTLQDFLQLGTTVSRSVVTGISIAEEAGGGTLKGPQKKDIVLSTVSVIPEIVDAVRRKRITDWDMFLEGVRQVIDGFVKILNSFSKE